MTEDTRDIVERLDAASDYDPDGRSPGESLCAEAADEILRLRRDVKALKAVCRENAVIVKDGATAYVQGPIGLLEVLGGIVNIEPRGPAVGITNLTNPED